MAKQYDLVIVEGRPPIGDGATSVVVTVFGCQLSWPSDRVHVCWLVQGVCPTGGCISATLNCE
jgi:hypothetical protein